MMESPEKSEPTTEVVVNPLLELLANYKVAHASFIKASNNLLKYYLEQIDYYLNNDKKPLAWQVVESITERQMQMIAAQHFLGKET